MKPTTGVKIESMEPNASLTAHVGKSIQFNVSEAQSRDDGADVKQTELVINPNQGFAYKAINDNENNSHHPTDASEASVKFNVGKNFEFYGHENNSEFKVVTSENKAATETVVFDGTNIDLIDTATAANLSMKADTGLLFNSLQQSANLQANVGGEIKMTLAKVKGTTDNIPNISKIHLNNQGILIDTPHYDASQEFNSGKNINLISGDAHDSDAGNKFKQPVGAAAKTSINIIDINKSVDKDNNHDETGGGNINIGTRRGAIINRAYNGIEIHSGQGFKKNDSSTTAHNLYTVDTSNNTSNFSDITLHAHTHSEQDDLTHSGAQKHGGIYLLVGDQTDQAAWRTSDRIERNLARHTGVNINNDDKKSKFVLDAPWSETYIHRDSDINIKKNYNIDVGETATINVNNTKASSAGIDTNSQYFTTVPANTGILAAESSTTYESPGLNLTSGEGFNIETNVGVPTTGTSHVSRIKVNANNTNIGVNEKLEIGVENFGGDTSTSSLHLYAGTDKSIMEEESHANVTDMNIWNKWHNKSEIILGQNKGTTNYITRDSAIQLNTKGGIGLNWGKDSDKTVAHYFFVFYYY